MAKFFEGTDSEWDELFAGKNYSGLFLQSSLWFRIAAARGQRCVRVIDDAGDPSLWVSLKIIPGIWAWFCPKGPVFEMDADVFSKIVNLLQGEFHATIVRTEPAINGYLVEAATKRKDVSPADTLITNLSEDFETLQKSFHEKTRYNIRVAERHGVAVRKLEREEAVARAKELFALYQKTGDRHAIQETPFTHMRALFEFGDIWVAEREGVIIATSVHIGFGDTMTYVHGASDYEAREAMGPYGLHAAAMRDAAARGFQRYDWWGVAPENQEKHRLAGVTRFKMGFGGVRESSPGTFDIPVDRARFALYTLLRRMRS